MIDLETSLRSMIRACEVTKASDDTKAFPLAQVKYMDKVSDAYEVYPYGMCAVAPAGSLGILLNLMAQEENKACIATMVEKRFNGLKEGEVAFGNFLTGSFVKFLEDGSIQVFSAKDLIGEVTGDVTLTATTFNLTGDVAITGALSVDGDITNTGDITSDGAVQGATVTDGTIDLATHVHPINSGSSAPGPTGLPQ